MRIGSISLHRKAGASSGCPAEVRSSVRALGATVVTDRACRQNCSRYSTPTLKQEVLRLRAVPEHRVRFDNLPGEPRNADIVAIGDDLNGRLAISVEAKADEPFDQYVRDTLLSAVKTIAADGSTNAVKRIQDLAKSILPPPANDAKSLGDLRYQLLTGIAGAIAFATEAGAIRAAFLVHEFITDRTRDERHRTNALDLDSFVFRLSQGLIASMPSGVLLGPFQIPGPPLFKNAPPLFLGKAVRNLRTI